MMRYVLRTILAAILMVAFPHMVLAQEGATSPVVDDAPVADMSLLPDQEAAAPAPQSNENMQSSPIAEGTVSEAIPSGAPVLPEINAPSGEAVLSPDVTSLFEEPVDVSKMLSLFFTKWEHDLLIDARKGVTTRPVVPGDAGSELLMAPGDGGIIDSPREISLGGITYLSTENWTIWLNGIRITPTALPPEIMDIKVYKDRIELDWLDRSANQIYPIRLRTHEKFNLDTRMFLPADGQ